MNKIENAVIEGLNLLNDMTHGCQTVNGIGFNKNDYNFGKSLCTWANTKGYLSPKQVYYGIRLLNTYKNTQLPPEIVEILNPYFNKERDYLKDNETGNFESIVKEISPEERERKEKEEKERIEREEKEKIEIERKEREREEKERIEKEREEKEKENFWVSYNPENEENETNLYKKCIAYLSRFCWDIYELKKPSMYTIKEDFENMLSNYTLEQVNNNLRKNKCFLPENVNKKVNDFYEKNYQIVYYKDSFGEIYIKPLCEETENLLMPERKHEGEYLEISLDGKGTHFVVEPKINREISMSYYLSRGTREAIQKIPEKMQPKNWISDDRLSNKWIVGLTDVSALIMRNEFKDVIHFKTATYKNKEKDLEIIRTAKDTQIAYEYLIMRFMQLSKISVEISKYKNEKILGEMPKYYVEHKENPLKDFQKAAMTFGVNPEGFAFFMEQGTGKTPVTISIIDTIARKIRLEENRLCKVLIIGPKQVRTNWQAEFERFSTCPCSSTIVRGNKEERITCVVSGLRREGDYKVEMEAFKKGEISTLSYPYFSAIIAGYQSIGNTKEVFFYPGLIWDIIVIDESHNIKSPITNRWEDISALRDISKKRIILTGTPICNNPYDLWTQLEFLGQGLSGFSSFNGFKRFYNKIRSQGSYEIIECLKNLPLLQERLARVSFNITKKEANLQLPDKLYNIIEVEMTPKQANIYESMSDLMLAEIETQIAKEGGIMSPMTASNILTKLLRLSQITSGFVTTDEILDPATGNVVRPKTIENIDNPKLDELINSIRETMYNVVIDENGKESYKDNDEKCIIWAIWRQDIKNISERLSYEGIRHVTFYGDTSDKEREDAINSFNKQTNMRIFLGNPASAKEGLNLLGYDKEKPEEYKTNCSIVYYYSQNFSMTQRCQSEDRANRIGARVPTMYYDLTIPGTIDEEIRKRVKRKIDTALEIQDIKDILANMGSGKYKSS